MSLKKKDYYGKEITEAIKKACNDLKVPQEELDIEVVETGSTGIFGLIRKKAHIRATIKKESGEDEKKEPEVAPPPVPVVEEEVQEGVVAAAEPVTDTGKIQKEEKSIATDKSESLVEEKKQLSQEDIESIRKELSQLLDFMGYPATVTVEAEGTAVSCRIESESEELLIGQDGKTLDSMQYLLRKMIARRIPTRLRLSVDIGNYRERRREELKEKAVELASLVKEDGKTQVIPALSPSERRVVHMTLQDDKEIRSRSVGDGLFKKILIYKPGKGKKGGGRKNSHSRGRKGRGSRQKKE